MIDTTTPLLGEAQDIAFVYVTFADANEAKEVGLAAVDARLAACANIFPAHHSIYRWKGKVESATECAALLKTGQACTEELVRFIKARHSYDIPCIAVLTPDQISIPFGDWIRTSTKTIS